MSKHVIKGISKLVSNLLDLQLLSVDLILNIINSLVQLGDVHLPVLKSSFCIFEFILDTKDLFFQLFFPVIITLINFVKLKSWSWSIILVKFKIHCQKCTNHPPPTIINININIKVKRQKKDQKWCYAISKNNCQSDFQNDFLITKSHGPKVQSSWAPTHLNHSTPLKSP